MVRKAFLVLFVSLPLVVIGQAGGYGLIPNGGFEDSNSFHGSWKVNYGTTVFEDSIHQEGGRSLLIHSEAGHIDLFLDELSVPAPGSYKLSFWYRGKGVYQESEPFWVEIRGGKGRDPQLFRFGTEEAMNGLMEREWVYFSEKVELEEGGVYGLFIHTDLSHLWLDGLSLKKR